MASVLLSACDEGPGGGDASVGAGDLTVLLEAEDTITSGIAAGTGDEDITDGWDVTFERYAVAIGDIDLRFGTDPAITAAAGDVFAVDLTRVPAAGLPLWTVQDLMSGRWEIRYAIRGAAAGATRHESVTDADFAAMAAGDWTYLVRGTMSRADGQSCPPASLATVGAATPNGNTNADGDPCYDHSTVTFEIGAAAATTFGPCEIDGVPGFVVPSGGSQTVAATIHGDHLFFNGFPERTETGAIRLAQWWADADLDLDGAVTRAELEALAPSDLAEIDGRYQLGGSPITPLATMWDYVSAQLRTQGHFQGEGECALE